MCVSERERIGEKGAGVGNLYIIDVPKPKDILQQKTCAYIYIFPIQTRPSRIVM